MILLILKHWRIAVALLVLLVVALASFVLGRRSVPQLPAKVETHEVEVVKWKDRIVVQEVKVREAAETKVVYRDRVVSPDGTIREHEVEKTEAKETDTTTTAKTEDKQGASETVREVKVEAERSSWRAGVLVGGANPRFLPSPGLDFAAGAIVERRIVGPLSAGAWFLHTGQAGVAVTIEF